MTTRPAWIVAAAEVLQQTSAPRALSLLTDTLVTVTGADRARRVGARPDGRTSCPLPDRPAVLPGPPEGPHELAVPVPETTPGTGSAAWVLSRGEPFDDEVLVEVDEMLPMIRGLDRHVQLLARAVVPGPRAAARLTPRERVVLAELARGCTAAGIAARLGISPRTVHKHQEHLYRKLEAVDRLSAVLRGQELGLLPPAQPEPAWPVGAQPSSPRHTPRWYTSRSSSIRKSASSR